jgi:hypothetical protein
MGTAERAGHFTHEMDDMIDPLLLVEYTTCAHNGCDVVVFSVVH